MTPQHIPDTVNSLTKVDAIPEVFKSIDCTYSDEYYERGSLKTGGVAHL